jgi:hypothetical protein
MAGDRHDGRVLAAALSLSATFAAAQDDRAANAFLQAYCIDCHGGDTTKGKLDLTSAPPDPAAALWRTSRLRERVLAGEMPPPHAEAPKPTERADFVDWAAATLRRDVPKLAPDPGRVTVRRLSRTQWANSIRDLFGVTASSTAFPADDLGYGFDTIGDALTFSTLHLEKHLAAAAEVAAVVFDGEDPARPTVRRFEAEAMQLAAGPMTDMAGDVAFMITNATVEQAVQLPRDGTYRLRITAGADQAGDEPAKMVLRLDGKDLDTFDVDRRDLRTFELTTPLRGTDHRFALAFVNDYYDPKHADPARRDRNLRIDALEIVGPQEPRQLPPAMVWIHAAAPAQAREPADLRNFVGTLLGRIWRREPTAAEVDRLATLGAEAARSNGSRDEGLRRVLQAALASPHFLFRIETGANGEGDDEPLPGPALAARLSYFLWASTPDPALLDLGRSGRLIEPAVLSAEVARMLADPRADALATDFAAQWLELPSLWDRSPDPARFPGFDDELRSSLRTETELLFRAVLREGRDVRDLLDCDFTHVDRRLAAFYGLPEPASDGFHRVVLPPTLRDRGGVLGHASVLAVTSNPTRTSPVKRGKWVLEQLLGQPPPPPTAGTDSLRNEAAVDSAASFREQLAQHRSRTECAGCHVRMDSLGFALEHYDVIGRHRPTDAGGPIDCSGELPGGRRIDGLPGLKAVLREDPMFVRNAARKLFVYAIGREPRPIDRLRLDLDVDALLARGKVTVANLVLVVVHSDPFLRRGTMAK